MDGKGWGVNCPYPGEKEIPVIFRVYVLWGSLTHRNRPYPARYLASKLGDLLRQHLVDCRSRAAHLFYPVINFPVLPG